MQVTIFGSFYGKIFGIFFGSFSEHIFERVFFRSFSRIISARRWKRKPSASSLGLNKSVSEFFRTQQNRPRNFFRHTERKEGTKEGGKERKGGQGSGGCKIFFAKTEKRPSQLFSASSSKGCARKFYIIRRGRRGRGKEERRERTEGQGSGGVGCAHLNRLHPPVRDGPREYFPQDDAVAKHIRLLGVVLAVDHLLPDKKEINTHTQRKKNKTQERQKNKNTHTHKTQKGGEKNTKRAKTKKNENENKTKWKDQFVFQEKHTHKHNQTHNNKLPLYEDSPAWARGRWITLLPRWEHIIVSDFFQRRRWITSIKIGQ